MPITDDTLDFALLSAGTAVGVMARLALDRSTITVDERVSRSRPGCRSVENQGRGGRVIEFLVEPRMATAQQSIREQ